MVLSARRMWSEPDPPRRGFEDVDVQCDLLVDTLDQGSFLLESINAVELATQIEQWLSAADDMPFTFRSIDADDNARIIWFRPWHDGWAVGSPWADVGPFLVERVDLVDACRRFVAEIEDSGRSGKHRTER